MMIISATVLPFYGFLSVDGTSDSISWDQNTHDKSTYLIAVSSVSVEGGTNYRYVDHISLSGKCVRALGDCPAFNRCGNFAILQ